MVKAPLWVMWSLAELPVSCASRTPGGAAGVVSMVTESAAEIALVLPARSNCVAVSL
jgi:hypothetical protein